MLLLAPDQQVSGRLGHGGGNAGGELPGLNITASISGALQRVSQLRSPGSGGAGACMRMTACLRR